MSNISYFQPKQHRTPKNKMIVKFIPKDATEAHKADMAEKLLNEEDYMYYLALVLVHQAYNFMPPKHKEHIKNLIDAGILDDLAVSTKTNLTNSCVTHDEKFLCNNIEFTLPKGYVPRMRTVDTDGSIYVEAFREDGKRRIYEFMYYKSGKKYTWKKVDTQQLEEEIVDF